MPSVESGFQPNYIEQAPVLSEEERSREKWLEGVHDLLIQEYPALAVLFSEPEEYNKPMGGSRLFAPNGVDQRVEVRLGSEKHLDAEREKRTIFIARMAELLHIQPDDVNAEIFDTFLFLHEYGHAQDYVTNYLDNAELAEIPAPELANSWRTEYARQKSALPITEVTGEEMEAMLKQKSFDQILQEYPTMKERVEALGIHTLEEVITAQNLAYRNLPAEQYADTFAAQFIKSHMPEILADSERN